MRKTAANKDVHTRHVVKNHELVSYQGSDHYVLRHNFYDVDVYIEDHWHNSVEITYVVNGSKSQTIKKKRVPAPKGTLLIVNSGDSHDVQVDAGLEGIVLLVERSYLDFLAPQCKNKGFDLSGNDQAKSRIVDLLVCSVACQEKGDRLGAKIAILQILDVMVNELLMEGSYQQEKHDDDAYNLVLAIQEYIDYNYATKISLDDLARITSYNRTYLATVFKKKVGLTIFEYLKNKRLEQSLYELKSTRLTIVEIALNCGFSNIQAFNTQFKAAYAMTPNEYRKKQNISSLK